MRSEYFGPFYNRIRKSRQNFLDEIGADDAKGIIREVVEYELPTLKQEDIERAIERPTLKDDVRAYGTPYEVYGFDYEPGLVEQIAKDCEETERRGGRQGGVLPVMQAVCYGLYLNTKPSRDDKIWTITEDDYTSVGGAEGCVDRYIAYAIKRRCEIENLSDTDTEAEVDRWRRILFAFAEAAPGGGVTTKYIYKNDLVTLALEKEVLLNIELTLEHLARDKTRIIQLVDQPGEAEAEAEGDEQYCLGHDAIGLSLTRWKLEDENRKSLRDELERQEKRRKTSQYTSYYAAAIAIIIPLLLVYDRVFPDLSVTIHELYTSESNVELRFPTKGVSRAILAGEPFGERELQINDEIIVGTISGLSVGRNNFHLNLEGHIFAAPKSVPVKITYYPGWQVRQFPNRGLNSISPIIELDGPRIRLRDTRNGLAVKDFRQVGGSTLQEAKISPSRDFLVAGSNDGSLTVWSLKTQMLLRRVSGHNGEITGLVFSPDRSILYSASADKTVKQWTLPKLEPVGTVLSGGAAILGLAISPDGQMVASASADGTITVSNVASKFQKPQHIGRHMGKVLTIAFSPNGKLLLSSGDDKIMKIWETGTWTLKKEIKEYDIQDAAFSPDGKWIFSATSNAIAILWNAADFSIERAYTTSSEPVRRVGFSSDGQVFYWQSRNNELRVWDLATGDSLDAYSGHTDTIIGVDFSPDGDKIISGSHDKTLKLWEAKTGRLLETFVGHDGRVDWVKFSPDGTKVASSSHKGELILWDVATGKPVRNFEGHESGVSRIVFSPDGTKILSGSTNGHLKLWSTQTGIEERDFKVSGGPPTGVGVDTGVAISPDGKTVVSGGKDGKLRFWNVESGKLLFDIPLHEKKISDLQYLSDDETIVSGGRDGKVIFLNTKKRKKGKEITTDIQHIRDVAISPDDSRIVVGGIGELIYLWDLATRQQRSFSLPNPDIWGLAFSPDGDYVVSGGTDKILRLWWAELAPD